MVPPPRFAATLERLLGWRPPAPDEPDDAPRRPELFNVQQLEQHATRKAGRHQIDVRPHADKLLHRLEENERILVRTHDLVSSDSALSRRITPAAEWLLDNFYLIEEQIRTARRHLPSGYSKELPKLATGPNAHYPRVYDIALALIAHADGRIDSVGLNAYIEAYQAVQPLKLGELWAVPIMLRLALVENLRRVAIRIEQTHHARVLAAEWAQRLLAAVELNQTDLVMVMADMVRARLPFSGAFVAELSRHLSEQSPYLAFANTWFDLRLAEQGTTVEQAIRAEGQRQAADQVSMGNSIGSLRHLSSTDWREFVERHSRIEQILRQDPAGVYIDMDFATRDRYRHEVEALARRQARPEPDVAHHVLDLARAAGPPGDRRRHIGYYLIDRGRATLDHHGSIGLYLGGLLLTTLAIAIPVHESNPAMAVAVVLVASEVAVAAVNWLVTILARPRSLPRLDFRSGIPRQYRTMVVIPTMLSNAAGVDDLLRGLEVRYLANREPHLHYALLTDFNDAPQEHMPPDADIVRLARDGIEALNATYGADVFYLLHRPRRWNPADKVWMGYERKRGKLAAFNALVRGDAAGFSEVVGTAALLAEIRYVITLDTDTGLPRDSARTMIGAMAHVLNRPVFNTARTRVVDGYGILQPRVGSSMPGADRSWYARLLAADPGVDPYTRVVSDVYQDLFGEGTFIGKGIYEVDAFEQCCRAFPENAILSHDLLESAYARSGLLSDVVLYEGSPSSYPADVSRRHRWMRGDWQIVAWLFPWVPGPTGYRRNPVSLLSRWKILDNLRRSLVPAAMMGLLWTGWTSSRPLLVLGAIAAGPVLGLLGSLVRKPADLPLLAHLRGLGDGAVRQVVFALLVLTFLPYEAWTALDAILRTGVRLMTGKGLLEWKTSNASEASAYTRLGGFLRAMAVAPIAALVTLGLHRALGPTGPTMVALWLCAPLVAWWLSRPLTLRPMALSERQIKFLRSLARRTWRYFDDFVTAEENWLPPDNIQENPDRVVASRTSPTNIGVGLLAELAAYDFGYSSLSRMLLRTGQTLSTLERMDRYRGHFYNWYETRTLRPLPPLYVSTVDSGNLAAHLLVLARGCIELKQAPIFPPQTFAGLQDTLERLLDIGSPEVVACGRQALSLLQDRPTTLRVTADRLKQVEEIATHLVGMPDQSPESQYWALAFADACRGHRQDLLEGAAWLSATDVPPELARELDTVPTWSQVASMSHTLKLANLPVGLRQSIEDSAQTAARHIRALDEAARTCQEMADMDVAFLFDTTRDLFIIGYNVSDQRADASCYDLLASEARLGSFVAIAQAQVGQEHWFALGRTLTPTTAGPALVSWSGSMFEYLMPLLVMPTYSGTLLDQTYRAVVARQQEYAAQRGVPWGISESGYHTVDLHRNYQYRAFGVPGLALKRGMADDVVIAPYATALALMVDARASCDNLERLQADGHLGACGFYEAIDYTPSRLPPDATQVTLLQYMAHHQGMTLLSLAYTLLNRPMQRRFEADPMLAATDLLLQERVLPSLGLVAPRSDEAGFRPAALPREEETTRVLSDPNRAVPEVHLLSNGRYHVVLTSAGGGYSRWGEVAVTRWREDPTCDNWGAFCYVRDLDTGQFWSSAWQPSGRATRQYEAVFSLAKAEFRRQDEGIDTHTEVSISSEDDVEVRRIRLTNRSEGVRLIEVTSYAEVVLAPQNQDLAHPAFSNLFVQTELVLERDAIFCTRRPRSSEERPPWLVHLMTVRGTAVGDVSFETDRSRFVGRTRSLVAPAAMDAGSALSGSEGSVLDPIVSIRRIVRLQPGETIRVDLVYGMAETREAVSGLLDKYHDLRLASRVFELAWAQSQVRLTQLQATVGEAHAYSRLAGSIVYASAVHRSPSSVLARNRRGQSALWQYGISGDVPIVLVRIHDAAGLDLVRQSLRAHEYWRLKGLTVDLVILNEDDSGYLQLLHQAIADQVAASPAATQIDRPGGVFMRRSEQMPEEDRLLLQTVARVVLLQDAGTLVEQTGRRGRGDAGTGTFKPQRRRTEPLSPAPAAPRDLAFFNGLGGFSQDGREYVMQLAPGAATPAPWVNVIANHAFGTLVSEMGSGYTWAENSHEFRLTPWVNDPVSDGGGEAVYVRDEETGRFWSPGPWPARGLNPYVVRHGFGYSTFEAAEDGIETELMMYVATDAPVKFLRLRIANRSGRPRPLSVTGYWEWVLGDVKARSSMHVVSEIDPMSGAMFVRNPYSAEFADRVVFVDASHADRSVTGDRTEFLGRNGRPGSPAAMRRVRLSGRVGAGLDPCTALQVPLTLEDGEEQVVVFMVGCAGSEDEARRLASELRGPARAYQALEAIWAFWSRTLGVVHVETPDKALNYLANGWLIYQVLSCRMWARTGFYQSGGAFGFRDQLQDGMALIHSQPGLLREHLLRAASRQFVEGDVQHWWHPPAGRGTRSRFSDDFLWLPYATCRYVATTGDTGVLEERIPFLSGRALRPDEPEYYDLPQVSDQVESLYEHCRRAIEHGLRFGPHHLPLMGCGDWNDGMNLVGQGGQGESVWLAFFLSDVLVGFSRLAAARGDITLVARYTTVVDSLKDRVAESGWDGEWYRRAYFDDGQPLGSATNVECQIDSLPQSWSVLSQVGPVERQRLAMDQVYRRLVDTDARLIQLFTPPFDTTSVQNPGYIKGYPVGVRENGGQYTHAAVWAVMAMAALGEPARAWDMFAMLNPVGRDNTALYRVEPYVMPADVYGGDFHRGRGGWTWYTGSAAWMYRLVTESLLGLHLAVDRLSFTPCMPEDWSSYKIHYRYRETFYHITLRRSTGVGRVVLDGAEQGDRTVTLVDDRNDHHVEVELAANVLEVVGLGPDRV